MTGKDDHESTSTSILKKEKPDKNPNVKLGKGAKGQPQKLCALYEVMNGEDNPAWKPTTPTRTTRQSTTRRGWYLLIQKNHYTKRVDQAKPTVVLVMQ